MNKYEEALAKIRNHCLSSPSELMGEEFGFGADYDMQHDGYELETFLLNELVDKETELQSRKDKLIVGSKWECVVTCYGQDWCWRYGTDVVITNIGNGELVSYNDTKWTDIQDEQPETQFMVCFKPKDNDLESVVEVDEDLNEIEE